MDIRQAGPPRLFIRFLQFIAIVLATSGFLALMRFVSDVLRGSPDGPLGPLFRGIGIAAALLIAIPIADHFWGQPTRTTNILTIGLWVCGTIASVLFATVRGEHSVGGLLIAYGITMAVPTFGTLGVVSFLRDRVRNRTLRLVGGIAAAIGLAGVTPIVGIFSSCAILRACL